MYLCKIYERQIFFSYLHNFSQKAYKYANTQLLYKYQQQ